MREHHIKYGIAAVLSLIAALSLVSPACADGQLSRIRDRGVVRCGGVERPGLAQAGSDGHWQGLEVDVCRAIAAAALGSPERIEFHEYVSSSDFQRVRQQVDDVYFLTGHEIAVEQLSDSIVPGPVVYVASDAVMVPGTSAAHHVADLARQGVCFLIADSAERSLESYFDSAALPWFRHPYSEPGEMNDAYLAQRCHGIAGQSTELARIRALPGSAGLHSRLLPEPLNVFPVIAATGTGDGRWSAIVAWTVNTLVAAERPETKWFAGGARAMPLAAPGLGLEPNWQDRVLKATGHIGQIYSRNLGMDSALQLDRGLNANQLQGGVFIAPFVE